ncbi:MAG: hypothetical protein ACO24Z_05550 [Arenimonas sp.]
MKAANEKPGAEASAEGVERKRPGGRKKLSAEEKARRERQRQSLKGFTSFQLSRDGTRLLVSLSGKLYAVNRADLSFTELPGTGWIDPRFSPDGTMVAGVIDQEVHLVDLASNSLRRLTHGAGGANNSNGESLHSTGILRGIGY